MATERDRRARQATTFHDRTWVSCPIIVICIWLLARRNESVNVRQYQQTINLCRETLKSFQIKQTLKLLSVVVNHAHIVKAQPQKKGVVFTIITVKDFFCVGQFSQIFGKLTIFGTGTQQSVETSARPQQSKPISHGRKIQNGNTRKNKDFPPNRELGHIYGYQGHRLLYTNTGSVQEVSTFSHSRSVLLIQITTIWSVYSSHGDKCDRKAFKLMALNNILESTSS